MHKISDQMIIYQNYLFVKKKKELYVAEMVIIRAYVAETRSVRCRNMTMQCMQQNW